jgi:hypothetical protein
MTVRITIEMDADDERAHALLRTLASVLGGQGEIIAAEAEEPQAEGETRASRKRTPRRKRARRGEGVIALVRKLRIDGFFDEAHSARDVRSELVRLGHSIDNRQIYATLKYLMDRNLLRRVDSDGSYQYIVA